MRRVFFSFKYDDVWQSNIVRNSWILASSTERQAFGFVDAAEREALKRKGDAAIARWIRQQMSGTSVTVVLMGARTCESRWVRFEIEESVRERKGLLGIRIHEIKNASQEKWTDSSYSLVEIGLNSVPENMFDKFLVTRGTKIDDFIFSSMPTDAMPTDVKWKPDAYILEQISSKPLSSYYQTYDWKRDNGRENIASWIERAAKTAGRS